MKLLYTLASILLFGSSLFAQWEKTSVSANPAEIVYDIAEHNGSLYAALNSKGLVKYNGSSWDSIPLSGFTWNISSMHIERIISNSNTLYAVVQDQICSSSIIYKSADNGLTFVADTAGLPRQSCDNKPMNVNFLYSDGDYLFLTLSSGSNTYRKKPSDASWAINPTDVNLASRFAGNNNKWYGFYHNLVVSTDFGQTWSTPANSGLPSSNIANGLHIDQSNNRIYLPLEIYTTFGTELVYTDNEGESWNTVDVNQYLTKDWIGLKTQKIVSMVSDGDFIELALVNNKSKTKPDFLVSTDGGVSFSQDTIGLPFDNWGTMAARAMLIYNNSIYTALGPDVYKKSLGPAGVNSIKNNTNHVLSPNPSNGLVYISGISGETIDLYNLQGSKLKTQKSSTLDLSQFSNGVYFIKISSPTKTEILKVIKN